MIQSTGSPPCKGKFVGHIQNVIEADIPKELFENWILARDIEFGFELASPKGKESLGESVIVNSLCYTTSTDQSSQDFYQVISAPEFITGGMFCLPKASKPTHTWFEEKLTSPLSFQEFYEKSYATIAKPFAFVGFFTFSHFHGIAISQPPINQKNIFEHKKEYFNQPEVKLKHQYGFVMGVVANFNQIQDKELKEGLSSVLYQNPFDQEVSLDHHAHCLLFDKRIDHYQEIKPKHVNKCLHLFVDGTTIESMEVEFFAIDRMKNFFKRQ